MRQIINISLPESMAKYVNNAVKKGRFASKSEFFRHLLREQSENDLYKELKKDQKEFKKGNGILLHTLKDLR
ncbi:MAG: ribbon-helix-helix domain-containing protein [Candidatus Shapirobacteria bacterium]|jgi:putative addiction module CopG family antidote|nr:ribbon-helix-helix domain-containing protein [Candidatus Shapirobacteria bacterium]